MTLTWGRGRFEQGLVVVRLLVEGELNTRSRLGLSG